jgi:hypothetical protein
VLDSEAKVESLRPRQACMERGTTFLSYHAFVPGPFMRLSQRHVFFSELLYKDKRMATVCGLLLSLKWQHLRKQQ